MKAKMITRTLIFTEIEIVAFNTVSMTGAKKVVSIVGNFKSDKDAMKAVISMTVPMNITIVSTHVVGHTTKLYGMTESDFYKFAEELPHRKVYEYDIVATN